MKFIESLRRSAGVRLSLFLTAAALIVPFLLLHNPSQVVFPQDSAPALWSMGFFTTFEPNYSIADIDWGALTHVIQVGVEPQSSGSLAYSDKNFSANATALIAAAHANNIKALLNVWSGSGSDFNGAISNNLSTLVNNIMDLVNTYGYDGVDLDWEAGMNFSSMTALLSNLRTRLGTKLLTADVNSNHYMYWGSVHGYLDRVSIMTYDMNGTWNPYSWLNSALYGDSYNSVWSVELARQRMLGAGVPASRLNIGLPFYGYVSTGGGITGPRQIWGNSMPSLSQISYRNLYLSYNLSNPHWDNLAHVPYLTLSNGWITYDNEQSIAAKIDYVKTHNLGGWIIWDVNKDYLPDQTPKHPLLTAVKNAMAIKPASDSVFTTPH